MGCDIHIFTERKSAEGKWLCTDFFEINLYYGEEGEDSVYSHKAFYNDRNYFLFGALAGVRREHVPHIEPKGLPLDASKQCLDDFRRWDADAHTPSWLTLKELKTLVMEDLITENHAALNEFMEQLKNFLKLKFYSFELDKMNDSDFRVVFWFDN